MATPEEHRDLSSVPEAVVDEEHKGLPVVWLLPLVALIVGAWLIYKTVSETGPSITINFATAEGIQAGKTKVKYRDVDVGQVGNVTFSEDLSHIVVHATLDPGTDGFLREQTRFWVVKPRVGAAGVSGLGTLVSGAYIAMEPATQGKSEKRFTGLEKPPVVTTDVEGTSYRLRAQRLGSVAIGAPVYFRQFEVGEITESSLSEDHTHVDIGIFVRAPHDRYIREGTRFWNAGGVNLSMSAAGVQLEMESVVSLLTGGIAFETLPEDRNTPVAKENTVFALHDTRAEMLETPITIARSFITRFSGSVRGLSVGAPVEFRGIRVGTVKSIELGSAPNQPDINVPVVIIDLEPQRLTGLVRVDQPDDSEERRKNFEAHTVNIIEKMVREKGLRARLQAGNLVTGQLYVDLDFFPDAQPVELTQVGEFPEIPTLPNPIEGILIGFNRIIDKLEEANLEETLDNLNVLMVSSNQLISTLGKNAPALAAELEKTIQEARATLISLRDVASTDGEIGNELYNALAEITAAARSLRVMSEYLERHPEALIKGKTGNP